MNSEQMWSSYQTNCSLNTCSNKRFTSSWLPRLGKQSSSHISYPLDLTLESRGDQPFDHIPHIHVVLILPPCGKCLWKKYTTTHNLTAVPLALSLLFKRKDSSLINGLPTCLLCELNGVTKIKKCPKMAIK
jgi:hypothetical protein